MGAGHGHKLHFHGHSPVHRDPGAPEDPGAARRSCSSWWPRRATGTRPTPSTWPRSRVVVGDLAGAADVPPQADGRRDPVRGLRGAAAVRRARPADRGARRERQPARARGRRARCWSRARSACWPASPWPRPPSRRSCWSASSGCGCRQLLVQIMAFMVRYLDVVTGEMQRMKVARESRGFTARNPRHWPVLARSAGRAVHPLLRARRAGPPGDAVARLHRQDAATP